MYNQQQAGFQGAQRAFQPTGFVQSQYSGQAGARGQFGVSQGITQNASANQFHLSNYVGDQAPYATNQFEQATTQGGQQQFQQGGQTQLQNSNQFHTANYKGNQAGYNVNQYFQPTSTANQGTSYQQSFQPQSFGAQNFGAAGFQSSAAFGGAQSATQQSFAPLQNANQFHTANYKGNQPGYSVNQYFQPTSTGNQGSSFAGQQAQQNSLAFHQAGYQGNQSI
ncbi:hypothetical protein [Marinicrinis lubricantis]|uniref:Uncharacterized protein n=1 Tax=Marinicrinis lubricantis TaxID=2086470 RepID=A0ABW1IRG1_9BACL